MELYESELMKRSEIQIGDQRPDNDLHIRAYVGENN